MSRCVPDQAILGSKSGWGSEPSKHLGETRHRAAVLIFFKESAMNQSWNRFGVLVAVGALAIGTLAFMGRVHGYADKDDKAPVSGPRYTVVETEGHNLIVTDNQSNSL